MTPLKLVQARVEVLYVTAACHVDGSVIGTSAHCVGLVAGGWLRLLATLERKKCQSGGVGGVVTGASFTYTYTPSANELRFDQPVAPSVDGTNVAGPAAAAVPAFNAAPFI
jgi:hypothetical protein